MRKVLLHFLSLLSALAFIIPWTSAVGAGLPCNSACFAPPDQTGGSASLPADCAYVTLTDKLRITVGLPPGTTIEMTAQLHGFFKIANTPGGSLGGDHETFYGSLQLDMKGTGTLLGWSGVKNVPLGGGGLLDSVMIDNAPRGSGSPQSFASDLFRLQGQLPIGDPDFDLLKITAGTDFGMPSPGHTTLTKQGGGTWQVDSFFDIEYRIDFIGAPGGPVAGRSGSTTATIRITQGGHKFWTLADGSVMRNPQEPDPAGWDVYGVYPMVLGDDWLATETTPVKDIHFWGSWLNDIVGGIDSFNVTIREDIPAGVDLPYSHPGVTLWQRNVTNFCVLPFLPATLEGWYDPSSGSVISNNHNAYFQYDVELDEPDWFNQTGGTIYWLCITAYLTDPFTFWGWKSTQNHFNDDAVWLQRLPSTCVAPDNGTGTIDLPAPQCPYVNEGGTFDIINGLPPLTQINSNGMISNFFDITRTPDPLGGELDDYSALLQLQMTGSGALSGFSKHVLLPLSGVGANQMVHKPRVPGDPIQSFDSDMFRMSGQLPIGDPDFDLLKITAGTDFGMPSPGHTTLTQISGGQWNVDSFFDISYRIDFIGHPGGPLGGMSGSTTATIRIHQGGPPITTWIDLWEPPQFTTSMDLAFVITNGVTTTPCLCKPGDANGDNAIDISDVVSLIAYIFSGGSKPKPYAICSGDANCDCAVDISDAVYLIAYIFSGGTAPCTCQEWLTKCGPPIRK